MNNFALGLCVVILPIARLLDNAGVHDSIFQH